MLPIISTTALIETSLFDYPFVKDSMKTIERPFLLSPDCKCAIKECVTPQTLEAQEILLEAGQLSDRLYWIETGLVRFFADADADADADITTGFCSEGDFFCAISSFFSQKPSTESICAEEPSVLYSIGFEDLQRLFGLYPELSHAFCGLYGHLLELHHARTTLLRYRTPHERYEAFLVQHPHLPNRLKVKHIASYLGIHRVTLCKIRKQLTHKKA